jgi:hypothetical protein
MTDRRSSSFFTQLKYRFLFGILISHLRSTIEHLQWRSTEEQTPSALFSVAICIFAKKECGSELREKGKVFPSFQKGPTNLNKFLLEGRSMKKAMIV